MTNPIEYIDRRKTEIAAMPRKELNGHAFLLEQDQVEYEEEIAEVDAWCEYWRREAFRKYPTPEAYETACKALEKHRARAMQADKRATDNWVLFLSAEDLRIQAEQERDEARQEISTYKAWQPNAWDSTQEFDRLKKANAALLEGLKWYAEKERYEWKQDDDSDPFDMPYTDILGDGGKRARSIIADLEGSKPNDTPTT